MTKINSNVIYVVKKKYILAIHLSFIHADIKYVKNVILIIMNIVVFVINQ